MFGENSRSLCIEFPPALPISSRVDDIVSALQDNSVVIVVGATGSGKTTQLPKIALKMGRGQDKLVGITQPRRIAATSVAARVASELSCEVGDAVGYQIRFEDRTSNDTALKFMTDGILLAEIQRDPLLRRYDTLIIDEAHERSLTIDFLLGWLKRILPKRPDLKIVVSSATIETQRFSEFFDGAKVIEVEGRTFPVDVLYEAPEHELDLTDAVADAVDTVNSLDPEGDILVFLPGEREIREAEQEIARRNPRAIEGRRLTVQPLYARLSASDQRRVFASVPGRKVILATNVAETSLTIPGIVYVIDAGVARLSRYDSRTGTTRLQIEDISQASADQRKGRCGRVREGVCIRLYDEDSFEGRPAFTDPEILRVGLAGVILRMKSLGLGEVDQFPFLDVPKPRAVTEGYRVLEELGALDGERELTPLGRRLARFPVDPRIGRMILAGADLGCLDDILVIAAALNIQDPRERPRGAEQKAEQAHAPFRDAGSDFVSLLKLWGFVSDARSSGTSQLRRICKKNYLSFLRVREWGELHRQLKDVVRDVKLRPRPLNQPPVTRGATTKISGGKQRLPPNEREAGGALHTALHTALLTGLLSRIGQFDPKARIYLGARQTRFALHPSSGLARKPPPWVMAFELVQTTRLFARTTARIDPEWLDGIADHLLKRSRSEPFWTERTARASVREQATLFGLPVFQDRSLDYASLSPGRARLMFLDHALVRGEFKSRGAFAQHNQQLLAEVARLRDKARQSDMLADDDALLTFFDERVANSVVNGKTFEIWRKKAEVSDPEVLHLSISDVLTNSSPLRPRDYPDTLTLHGVQVKLQYLFDPWAEDDGITVLLPLPLLVQLQADDLDWTIPAWQTEKLNALLERLPKSARRAVGAVQELLPQLQEQLSPHASSWVGQTRAAIQNVTGVDLPHEAFRVDELPGHLRFTIRLLGPRGNVIASSRDLSLLLRQFSHQAREALAKSPVVSHWERKAVLSWDFGDMPGAVNREVHGTVLRAYPAVVDRGTSVECVLCDSQQLADSATRGGVLRLLSLSTRRVQQTLAVRIPPPFVLSRTLPPSKTAVQAHRAVVMDSVLRDAYSLHVGETLPRTRKSFEALLNAGLPLIASRFEQLHQAIIGVQTELTSTVTALAVASRHPSGAEAQQDLQAQLRGLFPEKMLETTNRARLQQYPRYLKAMQIRLQRAVADPQKDAGKQAPISLLWSDFQGLQQGALKPEGLSALRWAFEELRVSVFAPELKPAINVSVGSLKKALAALESPRSSR